MLELNDLDVTIGVPAALPLERRAIVSDQVGLPRFLGPDGVEITLGAAWTEANMRPSPRMRFR